MTEQVERPVGRPLGLLVTPNSPYDENRGVIGTVERSLAGNTIIHAGKKLKSTEGSGWVKTLHIALTPDEREILIAELIATREG